MPRSVAIASRVDWSTNRSRFGLARNRGVGVTACDRRAYLGGVLVLMWLRPTVASGAVPAVELVSPLYEPGGDVIVVRYIGPDPFAR